MPVRIYDIAKKFGIESKAVLAKAKELGIAAKVPSSSLDKITAEFLESHFVPATPPELPPPAAALEPVALIAPAAFVEETPVVELKAPAQSTQEVSTPAGPISV